jgi:membrane-associated protease RseP (regulator of RpoE activity)
VISGVRAGTPAALAGLRAGDRIMSAGGKPVLSLGQLQAVVESAPIGEELSVEVERAGQRLEVKVRPQAQPSPTDPRGGVRSRIEPGPPQPERDAGRPKAQSRPRARQVDPAVPKVNPPDPETPELDPIPKS